MMELKRQKTTRDRFLSSCFTLR